MKTNMRCLVFPGTRESRSADGSSSKCASQLPPIRGGPKGPAGGRNLCTPATTTAAFCPHGGGGRGHKAAHSVHSPGNDCCSLRKTSSSSNMIQHSMLCTPSQVVSTKLCTPALSMSEFMCECSVFLLFYFIYLILASSVSHLNTLGIFGLIKYIGLFWIKEIIIIRWKVVCNIR